MRSEHPAAQPTQSKLSSPRQTLIKQISMWCSQTRKITRVYLSYRELPSLWRRKGRPESTWCEATKDAPLEKNCNFVPVAEMMCFLSKVMTTMDTKKHEYVSCIFPCAFLPSFLHTYCKSAHRQWKEPLILLLYLLMQYMFTSLPDNDGAIFRGSCLQSSTLPRVTRYLG